MVTDGEMRRLSIQSQMTQAVEGFGVPLRRLAIVLWYTVTLAVHVASMYLS